MKTSIELLESRIAPAGLIAVSVSSAGTLILQTVAGEDGDEVVTIDRLVDGGYQLSPGVNVELRIGGVDFTSAQTIHGVTGGLVASLGAGNDNITMFGANFPKGVSLNLGSGNNSLTLNNTSLGGALSVTSLDGTDSVSFTGTACAVAGAVSLNLGAGADTVTSSVDRLGLGRGLVVNAGAGNDTLSLATSDSDDIRVLGNVIFLAGDGDDSMTIGTTNTTFTATGTVQVTDKSGNETVTIAGVLFEAGAMVMQMSGGNNTLSSSATEFALARNLFWSGGAGTDSLNIVGSDLWIGSSVSVTLGNGNGTSALAPLFTCYIGGTVKMTAAALTSGTTRTLEVNSFDLMVAGKVTIAGGMGDGSVGILAGGPSLFLGGGAALSSGAGAGNVLLSSNGSLVSNGSVSLIHAGGDGRVELMASNTGDSAVNGALTMKGGDEMSVLMSGHLAGPVTLMTSPSAVNPPTIGISTLSTTERLTIGGPLLVSIPTRDGQSGTINAAGLILGGVATFLGGAGADVLRLDDIAAQRSVTASLGAGGDTFALEQGNQSNTSSYRGPVLLRGQAGSDFFQLGGFVASRAVAFFNAVTVDGGTETDILTVGNQTTFAPGFPLKQISIP